MVGKHTGNGCSLHLTSAGILFGVSIIAPNIFAALGESRIPLWSKRIPRTSPLPIKPSSSLRSNTTNWSEPRNTTFPRHFETPELIVLWALRLYLLS